MKAHILLLILIPMVFSCSQEKEETHYQINPKESWIDIKSACEIKFDSSFLYVENNKHKYYKISDHTLFVFPDEISSYSGSLPPGIQIFRIKHMDSDSLILAQHRSAYLQIGLYHLHFYRQDLIYDSTINLHSIRIENPVRQEVLNISRDSIFLRKNQADYMQADSLINSTIPIKVEQFEYLQNIIRSIDIENMDTVLPMYLKTHESWTINIKYNDTTKTFTGYGLCLTPAFHRIWNEVYNNSSNEDFLKPEV